MDADRSHYTLHSDQAWHRHTPLFGSRHDGVVLLLFNVLIVGRCAFIVCPTGRRASRVCRFSLALVRQGKYRFHAK